MSDDNLYEPQAIERMLAELDEEPDKDGVYADYLRFDETGALPEASPFFEEDGVKLVASPAWAETLTREAGRRDLSGLLDQWLGPNFVAI